MSKRMSYQIARALEIQVSVYLHPFSLHRILLFSRRWSAYIAAEAREEEWIEDAGRDVYL